MYHSGVTVSDINLSVINRENSSEARSRVINTNVHCLESEDIETGITDWKRSKETSNKTHNARTASCEASQCGVTNLQPVNQLRSN